MFITYLFTLLFAVEIVFSNYNSGIEKEKIFCYFTAIDRITDLKSLCTDVLPIIKPDIVLLTGDITDGKKIESFQSGQNVEDWKAYYSIFEQTRIQDKIHWFDLRGNHDVFGVLNAEDKNNYFSKFSIQGKTYPYSYMYTHIKSFGQYSFIGMDLTPSPGNKWPLNFFGNLITKIARTLTIFNEKVKGSNTTFWFGHYPTSSVISSNFDLRSLIGSNGFAYFSGHLHQLLFRHRMYARQKEDYLELELADWKDNRAFRIVAVDNDLVSMQDFRLGDGLSKAWPFGIITNPKNADFIVSNKEPVERILKSNAIRILAWSDVEITSVKVHIDNELYGEASLKYTKQEGLYELAWNPNDYRVGFHHIKVEITDGKDRQLVLKHHFSVRGEVGNFGFDRISHLLLCFNLESIFQVTIYTIWVIQFVSMILIRYLTKRVNGPIFVGYFVDDHLGAFFHYGLFINHTFLPIGLGSPDEFFFFLSYKLPTLFVILKKLSLKTKVSKESNRLTSAVKNDEESNVNVKLYQRFLSKIFNVNVLYIVVSGIFLCRFILFTMIPYGIVTILMSPSRIGVWLFDIFLIAYYIPKIKIVFIENERKE